MSLSKHDSTQGKPSFLSRIENAFRAHDSVEMIPEAGVFESQPEHTDATDIKDSINSPSSTERRACKISKICLYASSGRPRYALTPTLGINFALRV